MTGPVPQRHRLTWVTDEDGERDAYLGHEHHPYEREENDVLIPCGDDTESRADEWITSEGIPFTESFIVTGYESKKPNYGVWVCYRGMRPEDGVRVKLTWDTR